MGYVLLSQLMLLPVLIILTWIYLRLRPTGVRKYRRLSVGLFDAGVIAAGVVASTVGVVKVVDIKTGGNANLWIPVLSTLTTFHIFPTVLFVGWCLRRIWFPTK